MGKTILEGILDDQEAATERKIAEAQAAFAQAAERIVNGPARTPEQEENERILRKEERDQFYARCIGYSGLLLCIIAVGLCVMQIGSQDKSNAEQNQGYYGEWNLALRASTTTTAHQHATKCIETLRRERGQFSSKSAYGTPTPATTFEGAVDSLQDVIDRLTLALELTVDSPRYAEELARIGYAAKPAMSVISSCYERAHYPQVWGRVGGCLMLGYVCLGAWGWAMIARGSALEHAVFAARWKRKCQSALAGCEGVL